MILNHPRQRTHGFTRMQWVLILFLLVLAFEGGVRVAENKLASKPKPKPQMTNYPLTAPSEVAEEPLPDTNEVVVLNSPPAQVMITNSKPPQLPRAPSTARAPQMIKAGYPEKVHKIPESPRYITVTNGAVGIRVALP